MTINRAILLVVLFFFVSCTNKKEVQTNIENPIILVSGYGSKVTVWENTGFVDFLQEKGLVYGGKLAVGEQNLNTIITEKEIVAKIDFFSLAYSDSTSRVEDLSLELEKAIKYVRKYTNAKKVMLLGYSMGGVVCRNYLVENRKHHYVESLITISSPHKGSFLANIATSTSGYVAEKAAGIYLSLITRELELSVDGEALYNLLVEEDENFLSKLNNSQHPTDINYISIIGKNKLANTVNPLLSKLGLSVYDGDLVCSSESQNMNNISWFIENKPISLIAHEVNDVHHLNILVHHNDIYNYITHYITTITINEDVIANE